VLRVCSRAAQERQSPSARQQRAGHAKAGPRPGDFSPTPPPRTWAGDELLHGDDVNILETKSFCTRFNPKGQVNSGGRDAARDEDAEGEREAPASVAWLSSISLETVAIFIASLVTKYLHVLSVAANMHR